MPGKGRDATVAVAAAGWLWQDPHSGQLPWPSAMPAARAGWHTLKGSAGAENSCLLAFTSAPSTQPGFTSPLSVAVLPCPSALPHPLQEGNPRNARGSSAPHPQFEGGAMMHTVTGAAPRRYEDKVQGLPHCGGWLGRGIGCLFAFFNAQL